MSGSTGQLALIARVARSRELRRVQLAFVAFAIAEHATWLAVFVYALGRGGPTEVGVVAVAQLAPAVLLTPFSSYAGDRFAPRRALAVGYGMQFATMSATAVAMWSDAPIVAYVFAAGAATTVSFIRPVMGALLPSVTHAPADLVAANVVVGLIEQVGIMIGPLVAGVVLAVGSPAGVFLAAAMGTGAACVSIVAVRVDDDDPVQRPDAGDALQVAFAGFATLVKNQRLRVLLVVVGVAGLVQGVGDIVFVVFAAERLGGDDWVAGVLAGAFGIGGLLGALGATRMVRSARVSGQFLAAAVLIGAALLGAAWATSSAPAIVSIGLLGAGNSLLVLTATVTIQRQAPIEVLARVFGIVEGTKMAMIAGGSVLVSVLVAQMSLAAAFAVIAGATTAVLVCCIALLGRDGEDLEPVDASIVQRLLLDPVLAPLHAPTIELLARGAERLSTDAGEPIIREGELGDRYYLIVDGTVEITQDGQHLRALSGGASFGEIALLDEVPRTASATSVTRCELLSVERDDFLEAVTGHSRALRTARDVADGFLNGGAR